MKDGMKVYDEYRLVEHETFKFSGGEIQVKVKGPKKLLGSGVVIDARLRNSDNIMELALLTDALRRAYGADIVLRCPYLPYARQDRVCYPGEALSLKVMCDIINSLKFKSVEVWDVHSDVALALLNNVDHFQQWEFYEKIRQHLNANPILVSPDSGALKKTLETAKRYKLQAITAEKKRDTATGEITGTVVHSSGNFIGDNDLLVMDDICDGGRTFEELGKVLLPMTKGKLYLYVTHGIFSKGIENLLGYYSKIFTVNSWIEDPRIYDLCIR